METVIKEQLTVKVIETEKGKPRVLEGARVIISPVFDESKGTTALKTGISREDWELHYKPTFGDYDKFYENMQVVLNHKTRHFDLSEPFNRIVQALLKVHPWIANSPKEITQASLFILYDEVEEAKLENKAFEYELKAFKYLYDMSQVDRARFLKLFGVWRTENVSPEIVAKRLKDKAKENPKLFVETYEDRNKEVKIFIEELLEAGIISKSSGMYSFGIDKDSMVLGATIEQLVEFMRDPKNNDIVLQFKRLLELKKKA